MYFKWSMDCPPSSDTQATKFCLSVSANKNLCIIAALDNILLPIPRGITLQIRAPGLCWISFLAKSWWNCGLSDLCKKSCGKNTRPKNIKSLYALANISSLSDISDADGIILIFLFSTFNLFHSTKL